jgi:hypothetical protein
MRKILSIIFILVFSVGALAQQYKIEGIVTDRETDRSLSFTNIRVTGTTTGTAANLEGKFELKLKAGSYVLVASYIGYYSDTIIVDLSEDITGLAFKLSKTEVILPEVVILAGENPALEIIRKAIEKKNERNEKLDSYEFEAYTKGAVRTEDDFSATGNDVVLGFDSGDSTELKITGILENQSRGYYQKPDNYKEIILARKQSSNFPPSINTVTGGRVIQNFYDDDVNFLGGDLPGPLSDDALSYYYFYIERIVAMDDNKVYRIHMEPDDPDDPGFEGRVFITDSTYDLIKVDLRLNRAANPGGIFDTINVFQQFASYDEIYMPVDYRLFLKANFLGLARFGFELNSVLYDYKTNPSIGEDEFSKAIVTVLPEADKKDSLYWLSTQTIPNTNEEDLAYRRIDSISLVPVTFWDRFEILSTRTYFSDNFAINAPLNFYHFNRVEGHALKLGLYLDDFYDQRLNSSLEFSYGFSDKDFKTDYSAEYLLGDYRTTSIRVNIYNKLKVLFGSSIAYWGITASLLALLNKEEFRDYYYSNGFDIEIEGEVFPILSMRAGFINHTDKSAMNNSDFSFFRKDRSYKENPPIYETKINALTAGFDLDFRDYIEDGYYRRRTSFGRSYILFSGDVTYSSKDLLKSNLDFTTYELRIRSFLRTFRSASMRLRLYGMHNSGTLPYQDMYGLPGNINIISKQNTFRTLRINEVFGERVITLNLEHDFRSELFRLLNIPLLKDWEITLNTFFNAAVSEIGNKSAALLPAEVKTFPSPFYEVGFGIGQGILPLQLEFAWKINYRGDNNFVISLNTFAF